MNKKIILILTIVAASLFLSGCTEQQNPVDQSQNPSVKISVTLETGIAPITASFQSNVDTGMNYSWDFGNGKSSYQKEPTHTYTTPGTYTVTLTVQLNDGTTASDTMQVNIAGSSVDVQLLGDTSFYDDEYFVIVGEVQNNKQTNIEFVKVTATFYDDSNTVIGSDFGYTDIDILTPGQKSPYELNSYPNWLDVDHYDLSVEYKTTEDQPYENIEILSHSLVTNEGQYLHVPGEVKNTGSVTIEFVKIIVTFYDENGNVICKDFSYTDLDTLGPGQTSSFEASSYPQKTIDLDVSTYTAQVQGRPV